MSRKNAPVTRSQKNLQMFPTKTIRKHFTRSCTTKQQEQRFEFPENRIDDFVISVKPIRLSIPKGISPKLPMYKSSFKLQKSKKTPKQSEKEQITDTKDLDEKMQVHDVKEITISPEIIMPSSLKLLEFQISPALVCPSSKCGDISPLTIDASIAI